MASIQTKRQASELPSLIGSKITIRSNVDNSEKKGIIIAYDATKNSVQVDQNKSHFWVNLTTPGNVYIYTEAN